jgi:LPS-assembly lipoprotein
MKASTYLCLLVATLLLSACGFHLRGHNNMQVKLAFQSVYLRTASETPFVMELRKALVLNKVTESESAEDATVTLDIISETSDKMILSLSSAGKVLEFELHYRVSMSAYDKQLVYWLPTADVSLSRRMTYDDTQILAKEQEEALLYRDMRNDAVAQVLRRLSRAQPPKEQIEKTP